MGWLALVAFMAAGSLAAPDLDLQITTYNALPDTPAPLALADSDTALLPAWARIIATTRQEAAALVALAGAYGPSHAPAPAASGHHKRNPLEYVAGAALALKTQDVLNRAQPGTPATLCCATTDAATPKPQRIIPRPPAERFVRLIAGLESCPGAFAALALRIHAQHPGSQLDLLATRARTDRLEFATTPDPACHKN